MQSTGFHACESDPLQLWCLFLWIIVLRNDKGDKGQTFHSIGELQYHSPQCPGENSETIDPFSRVPCIWVFAWRSFA